MGESHKQLLPIIATHVDRMGYTFGKIEACLGRTGERADYWAMARRPVTAAYPEHPECIREGKEYVDLHPGSSSVHELKASVADLRADRDKPWRKPGSWALGERRFYWIPEGGQVRPEHVEESNGWGVVVFGWYDFTIVRPSAFFRCAYRDEHELIAQIAGDRAWLAWLAGQTFGRAPIAPARDEAPQDQAPTPPTRRVPAHIQKIKDFLSGGPASTAQIRRHLIQDHDTDIKPKKLATEMEQRKKLFKQDGAGGNWSLRTEGGEG